MKRTICLWTMGGAFLIMAVWATVDAEAASPSAAQALKLLPVQRGVELAELTPQEIAGCKISARKAGGQVGWVVETSQGLILRNFLDTNGDNVVDRWSYYKDGLEVYRDIDADYNGKADQYRWFHTGGSRWGLDSNQDGKIDAWKMISAEEVTAEVVAALAGQDVSRFIQLALTPDELESLGIGKSRTDLLAEKIGHLAAQFKTLAAQQKLVTPQTKWIQFSATRPGIVPVGTSGSSKELRVYENVVAIVRTGDKHGQVQIGTLVQVGQVWRVIDVPQPISEGQTDIAASGFFFRPEAVDRNAVGAAGANDESQKLLADLEKLDREVAQVTTPEQKAEFHRRRADLLYTISQQARSPQDRAMWLRQLADMISAAVQSGEFADGVTRLESLLTELEKNTTDKNLAAYFKFRKLTAAYGLSLQSPNADFAKIQTQWLKDLEQYATDYPTAPDAAEAMLQLAIAQEFAGQEDIAKKWYAEIVESFPDSAAARKAAGAQTRLNSVGMTIALTGKGSTGGVVDLAKYRGRVVLIQYWATWCEPAKKDMVALKELVSKHSNSLSVIGVNLDARAKDLADYLATHRLPWPQIYEEGGLDSRPANQLGILTLPTMILVDRQGKVVNRNIQMAELDGALKKLIR